MAKKQLLIEDKDIPSMLEFYSAKRSSVSKEIAEKQQELESIDRVISSLNSSITTHQEELKEQPRLPIGYPFSDTWFEKLKFVVEELGSATTTQIVDRLIFYEPENQSRRKTLVPTISGKLSENANEGGIFIRQKRSGHYEYRMAK